ECQLMKKVLVIGGGPELTNFEEFIVNTNDYEFFSVSVIPPTFGDLMKKSIIVDFRNWGETISSIKNMQINFDFLICLDEALTHIADNIAKELSLIPLSKFNSQPFKYKDRMRIVCEAHGINTPKYKIINDYKNSEQLINWNYPLIVKPTSFLASIGVKKVESFKELQAQVNQQLNIKFPLYFDKTYELGELYSLENRVIVEEFIDGEEYSLESIVTKNEYKVIGITKKITHEIDFMDEVGHIFPAQIPNHLKEKIEQWGQALHHALGIVNTVTHAEFRIDKKNNIYLIEIGARIGGDNISELIRYNSDNNFNFFEAYLKSREGKIFSHVLGKKFVGIAFIKVPTNAYGKIFESLTIPKITNTSTIIKNEYMFKERNSLAFPN
ncbi:TPA: acetyl-CoA carboxylase biotin carboxylase subunit family protein, partial [Enterococcus faecium]